jgi:addiction module RelB/DinJ family antitoxin
MAKTIISIKSDKEVKENAKKLAQELGLSLSDVINASLRNFIRMREVRFSSIPQMTPELERLLGKIEKDIKRKRDLSPVLESAEDAAGYLDSL